MSKFQRIRSIFIAFLMTACAFLLVLIPESGYRIVVFILAVTLVVNAVRSFVYYFSMARHMVDGRMLLFKGIIFFDAGMFTLSMTSVPTVYVIIYLILVFLFNAVIDLLRALELKKQAAKSWRFKLVMSIVSLGICVVCGIFIQNPLVVIYVYAFTLVYGAVTRLITAFRRTAIVYIQ